MRTPRDTEPVLHWRHISEGLFDHRTGAVLGWIQLSAGSLLTWFNGPNSGPALMGLGAIITGAATAYGILTRERRQEVELEYLKSKVTLLEVQHTDDVRTHYEDRARIHQLEEAQYRTRKDIEGVRAQGQANTDRISRTEQVRSLTPDPDASKLRLADEAKTAIPSEPDDRARGDTTEGGSPDCPRPE